MSPNYPNDYPNSVTCVWALKPGQAFQLEFEKFYTESGYDLLQGYSSLSSFTSKYTGHRRKGGRAVHLFLRFLTPLPMARGNLYLAYKVQRHPSSHFVRIHHGTSWPWNKQQISLLEQFPCLLANFYLFRTPSRNTSEVPFPIKVQVGCPLKFTWLLHCWLDHAVWSQFKYTSSCVSMYLQLI